MDYTLFAWGGVQLTVYGICIAAAAAVSAAVLYVSMRKLGQTVWAVYIAWCLPLALLCARLFYCMARISYISDLYGFGFVVRLWEGGYSLWGAAGGCVLAGLITAKRTGKDIKEILNAAVPAVLLALALCRFAEYFSGQGIGLLVENNALQFFPLSVQNEYGEWYFSVFIAEGITALVTLWMAVRVFKQDRALKTIMVIAASQIVWESMRRDMYLRWGFVRVTQLTAVLILFSIMLVLSIRHIRAGGEMIYPVVGNSVFTLLTGVCIALEFAMDKSPLPYGIAWLLMAVAAAGMCVMPWLMLYKAKTTMHTKLIHTQA